MKEKFYSYSFLKKLSQGAEEKSLVEVINAISSQLDKIPSHLIGEERQLTTILKEKSMHSLTQISLIVSSTQSVPLKKGVSFSEFVSFPDLCKSGAIVTVTEIVRDTNCQGNGFDEFGQSTASVLN